MDPQIINIYKKKTMSSAALVQNLEARLASKELGTGPTYDFVPKMHDHHDLSRWFCESFHALNRQDSTKVYALADAFRKGVWDVVQDVEHVEELDLENPKLEKLVKEMVRIMKFRVISYERTTRRVVKYTRDMIEKARMLAHMIMKKQDELSRHIQTQALEIKAQKIGQLPMRVETSFVVEQPEYGPAFQVQAQGSSKKEMMEALKKRAMGMYKELAKLREERVRAVLSHDRGQVKAIDARATLLKTYTRAITGARMHLASIGSDEVDDIGGGEQDMTAQKAMERLEKGMTHKKVADYDLYRQEVENQIDEHSTGMALYLGLKTQKEVGQLRHDLVLEVCKVVAKIFDEGREEIMLLNAEMATLHRSLLAEQVGGKAMKYLERVAKKYRASIAKIQLELLGLFDRR